MIISHLCWNVTGPPGLTNSVALVPGGSSAGDIWIGSVYFFEEAGELRIKKVINNNILCVVDEEYREQ